ncbi:tetratricopeptide repeat protein [Streptomyces hokutonensis]|uniref:tetratricopeptide repeat protein n=1 Tax=Streptomyces hokutonensis TaxID=1306990 RepID=UPI003811A95F
MANTYEGDHIDLSGGVFHGSVVGRVEHHQHLGSVPKAVASLPAAPAVFTGRDDELSRLLPLLDPTADTELPVLICAVSGLGGIGKTSLALHAAHRAADNGWFPGGMLFLDLRGYDDNPVTADQAVLALLEAFGIRGMDLPATTEAQHALYRSVLAQIEEPLLLVLDNASHPGHITPLLPGIRRHRVLVTSRHTLPTLGARLIDLKVLAPEAAVELLRDALRTADPADRRVVEAGENAREVAGLCGYLPLALHVVAALLVLEPEQSVAEVAGELARARSRLEYMHDGDRAVRASFDLSYRRLTPEQGDLLRLLALNPGPDVSLSGVTVLVDQPSVTVRTTLRELVRAHLVERTGERWSMHDLVRDYAAERVADVLTEETEPGADGSESPAESYHSARTRLLEYYFAGAGAADDHMSAHHGWLSHERFSSREQALAWLDAERSNLTGTVAVASATGHSRIAIQLPICLYAYLTRRRHFEDLIAVTALALDTARVTGDKPGEAKASNNLGIVFAEVDRYEEAFASFTRAAHLCAAMNDQHERGKALNGHGLALREAGRPAEALGMLREAFELQRCDGDRREQAAALNNLSLVHQDLENHAEAKEMAEQAASLFHQLKDLVNEATALGTMAWALHGQGRTQDAIITCERALETIGSLDEPQQKTALLLTLANLLEPIDPEQAVTHYRQAAVSCAQADNPVLQAHTQAAMAMVLINSSEHTRAVSPLREALQLYTALGLTDEVTGTQALLDAVSP